MPEQSLKPHKTLKPKFKAQSWVLWGFKSPAHFVWAVGFTENLSVDCHHKGHIVRHHYKLTVSSCNLNWFDTTEYGSTELNNCQYLWLPPIICKYLKEAVLCWLSAISCTTWPVRIPSSTCTNRLLLAALEEPEDSSTTQKEDVKKTPAISKHCMCSYYTRFCFVNDHGKFSMGILTYTTIYSCSSDPIILLLEAWISQI